jgi:hypothetical protein
MVVVRVEVERSLLDANRYQVLLARERVVQVGEPSRGQHSLSSRKGRRRIKYQASSNNQQIAPLDQQW